MWRVELKLEQASAVLGVSSKVLQNLVQFKVLRPRFRDNSYFLCGPHGNGKTHLLFAQYRTLVLAGLPCSARTTIELLNEIQSEELDPDSHSPMLAQINSGKRYHLFWDDVDKFKMTDFRSQGLFDLIDTFY